MTQRTLRDSLLQTAFITLTFTALPLSAATLDWDGSTSTDLTLNTNWLTDVLPANDLTTDIARFSGTAPANQPTLNTTRSINGLIFNGTGYTLGGTGTLTLGSGGIQVTGTGTNTISVLLAGANAPVSVASGATLNLSRSANTTFMQNYNGDGSVIFTGTNDGFNNGQSSHTISGTNTGLTSNASITASSSRLLIDSVADVGSARLINTGNGEFYFTNNTTYSNNMTLQGNGWGEVFAGNNIQLGAVRLSGTTLTGAITLAGNTRITAFGSTGTITGVINESGGARALEIGGGGATTGTITLTGASTYSGGTVVSGGTLQLGNAAGTDYGSIGRVRGNLTVANGATLSLVGSNVLGYGTGTKVETLNVNGGTVTTNVVGDNGWGLDIVMTGGTINGTGRISMGRGSVSDETSVTTNASANTATISVASMTLRSGNGLTGVNFTVADGAAATDLVVSSSLQAAGTAVGINKLGAGTMVLSGANTYAGTTNVNAGTLVLSNTGSIASSAVAVANGATFQVDTTGKTVSALTLAGGSRVNLSAGVGETTTSTGALTVSGGTFGGNKLTGNGLITVNSGATLALTGAHVLGGDNGQMTETVVLNGGTMTMTNEQYFNRLDLNGATVSGAGEIRGGNASDIRVIGSTASTISARISMNLNSANVLVDDVTGSSATDLTMSGTLAGISTVTFTKSGAGTMLLSNAGSDFAGNFNVIGGTVNTGTGQGGGTNGYFGLVSGTRTLTVGPGATVNFLANNQFGGRRQGRLRHSERRGQWRHVECHPLQHSRQRDVEQWCCAYPSHYRQWLV